MSETDTTQENYLHMAEQLREAADALEEQAQAVALSELKPWDGFLEEFSWAIHEDADATWGLRSHALSPRAVEWTTRVWDLPPDKEKVLINRVVRPQFPLFSEKLRATLRMRGLTSDELITIIESGKMKFSNVAEFLQRLQGDIDGLRLKERIADAINKTILEDSENEAITEVPVPISAVNWERDAAPLWIDLGHRKRNHRDWVYVRLDGGEYWDYSNISYTKAKQNVMDHYAALYCYRGDGIARLAWGRPAKRPTKSA